MAETNRQQLYAIVYEVVTEIPYGRVATYGQIAQLIGLPRHARHVGFALSSLENNSDVPWHRVVNSKGEIHLRHHKENSCQRQRLEQEGVVFNENGRINLRRYQWQP